MIALPVNAREVLGRKVGIPGINVGTIIAAGWSYKVAVERMTVNGRRYETVVPGYLVRWEIGVVSGPMPLDRLCRQDLLPLGEAL